MNKPTWDADGQPANVEAAASDALVWLWTFRALMVTGRVKLPQHTDSLEKLSRAATVLETFFLEEDADVLWRHGVQVASLTPEQ